MTAASANSGLPLEGVPASAEGSWSIRLPVRAEQVTLSKEVVVRERVVVHRRRIEEMARIEADLRREELRTTKQGHV